MSLKSSLFPLTSFHFHLVEGEKHTAQLCWASLEPGFGVKSMLPCFWQGWRWREVLGSGKCLKCFYFHHCIVKTDIIGCQRDCYIMGCLYSCSNIWRIQCSSCLYQTANALPVFIMYCRHLYVFLGTLCNIWGNSSQIQSSSMKYLLGGETLVFGTMY